MMEYMRQCKMTKPIKTGHLEQTSWIPEKFAKVGQYVKLKDDDGVWSDGWKVETVGGRQSARQTNIRSRDHLKQREASDI